MKMQFPKLTPLQARFAASLCASALLVFLYFSITRPSIAYAAELDSRIFSDHNHPILDFNLDDEDGAETIRASTEGAADADTWVKRAPVGISALANNAAQNLNIDPGQTQNWVVPKDVLNGPAGQAYLNLPQDGGIGARLRPQQSDMRMLYITLNTCIQAKSTNGNHAMPPQLQMWLSLSQGLQQPSPTTQDDPRQSPVSVSGGYAVAEVSANDDVYIGVSAPNGTDISDVWNYEIAASIDAPYHNMNATNPFLSFIDSDNHAALLVTDDLTSESSNSTIYQEWMSISPPFSMFAHNASDPTIAGIQNSFCGLKNLPSLIVANEAGVDNQNVAEMTNKYLYNKPKQQFYVTGLNASSSYTAWLALDRNTTAGSISGGGTVFAPSPFTTKGSDNCALMYNLSFCDSVSYAVPSNPYLFPLNSTQGQLPQLAAIYDSYAAEYYKYFNYSLQQIPCNTTATAQYSLVQNCTSCAAAYKKWLCAVTIPRCEDYASPEPWLHTRNLAQPFVNGSSVFSDSPSPHQQLLLDATATNSSRNPRIDTLIMPGPYKEVLPCRDLCYDLVRACPAILGFSCPSQGRGLKLSYGVRNATLGAAVQCNYPGQNYYQSGADATTWAAGLVAAALFVWFLVAVL